MSPLDDELRRTLTSRATTVEPAPDPLAGIEARVTRIRRRRAMAAVAGAAAVVAAVALAVPALVPDRDGSQVQPGTTPSATAPADPSTWAYRGNDIPSATLDAYRAAWQTRHPGSTMTPLFGQVYEPSATQELVFVAHGPDGYRVGVVQSTRCGVPSCPYPGWNPEFVYDEARSALTAEAFVLAGDETPRLLVVAAPDSTGLSSTNDAGHEAFTPLTTLAPGVGTGPVDAKHPALMVRLVLADGSGSDVEPYDFSRVPANLLTWGVRGTDAVSPSTLDLRTQFAKAFGRTDVDHTDYSPLFVGETDSGVHYTMGQAWFSDEQKAYSVSYATGGTNGPAFFLGPVTPTTPWGLAFLFSNVPGTSTDLLVVVPRPMTGQLSYSPDAASAFQPVANGRSDLNGIALIDRSKTATNDRLESLDGDGNLDQPLYRGPVAPLLCGLRECA
jgi:hypothetical protein